MEVEEIRAEIERRRKRAIDLGLRELLWKLYHSFLSRYAQQLEKDPAMILPELKESMEIAGGQYCFRAGDTFYMVSYKEGNSETRKERWLGRELERTTTTPATISLWANGASSFSFYMSREVRAARDMVYFSERMGTVLGFIEGPWVHEIAGLVQRIQQHERAVREERDSPRRVQLLQAEMKRFGF